MRLTILLCLWNGWRPLYNEDHVRATSRMLREYLKLDYRLVLLTDEKVGADCEVDAIAPLPYQPERWFGKINCYRRLRFFDPEYTGQFGTPWVMSLDLDTLLLDDMTPVVEKMMCPFGFSILRGRMASIRGQRPYNGGMYAIEVGKHAHVWSEWDWDTGPTLCSNSWRGSDQVWISLKLRGAPTISKKDGVYFIGEYLESDDGDPEPRIITYAGPMKPWSKVSRHETPELWREYQRWNFAS